MYQGGSQPFSRYRLMLASYLRDFTLPRALLFFMPSFSSCSLIHCSFYRAALIYDSMCSVSAAKCLRESQGSQNQCFYFLGCFFRGGFEGVNIFLALYWNSCGSTFLLDAVFYFINELGWLQSMSQHQSSSSSAFRLSRPRLAFPNEFTLLLSDYQLCYNVTLICLKVSGACEEVYFANRLFRSCRSAIFEIIIKYARLVDLVRLFAGCLLSGKFYYWLCLDQSDFQLMAQLIWSIFHCQQSNSQLLFSSMITLLTDLAEDSSLGCSL